MITIGIELKGSEAIFYALEQNGDNYKNITGSFKKLTLDDDTNNDQLRSFRDTIYSFFDTNKPDRIAIIKRSAKGQFAGGPITFKIEGLIQCYSKCNIELIASQTLSAHYKKNELKTPHDNKYQEKASQLAQYLNV